MTVKKTAYKTKKPDTFSYQTLFTMAGEVGVEPTPTVLETGILPLYYSPMR